MDELLTTREPAAGQPGLSRANPQLYEDYRRLAAEQAALRRLATLVARGVEPAEVFEAAVDEMRRCVPAQTAGLWRYESNDEITKVAAAEHPGMQPAKWPVGTRTPIDGGTLAAMVQRTGRPARMDSYGNVAG
jgi:GAF domain-containing protein